MVFDKVKVGRFLAWQKGGGDKWFLQYECFRYKARSCFTGYHIGSGHIGSECPSKRQDLHLLNACVTRCHTFVISNCQDNLHGQVCTQQSFYDAINPGRALRATLKKNGKYTWIEFEGSECFTSPA